MEKLRRRKIICLRTSRRFQIGIEQFNRKWARKLVGSRIAICESTTDRTLLQSTFEKCYRVRSKLDRPCHRLHLENSPSSKFAS